MNLRLYKYNNYYNRRIKSFSELTDLDDYLEFTEYNINFNPNDGVSTEHIIGGINSYSGGADYAILEEQNEIVSRWFVLESQRTRAGQYRLVLKRDSIADFYPAVMDAPCFIEKGWVPNSDPAIFNKEDLTFNQIKKNEILLKDKTNIPWLVGYYLKGQNMSVSVEASTPIANYTVNGLSAWTYYDYTTKPGKVLESFDLDCYFKPSDLNTNSRAWVGYKNISASGDSLYLLNSGVHAENSFNLHYTIDTDSFLWGIPGYAASSVDANVVKKLTENMRDFSSDIHNAVSLKFQDDFGYISSTTYDEVANLDGQIIFDSSAGKYYKIGAISQTGVSSTDNAIMPLTSTFGYTMYDVYAATQTDTGGIYGDRPTKATDAKDFAVGFPKVSTIQLKLTEISYKSSSVNINPSPSAFTQNAPYNIFAMPYGQMRLYDPNVGDNIFTDADTAMRVASALITGFSGGETPVLLDMQLLPYCPCQDLVNIVAGRTTPRADLRQLDATLWTSITSGTEVVGYIFNCTSSSAEFEIDQAIKITDYKIQNETEFCRLVSPNWNGMYEFSPAKNRGVSGFEVDVEFKPFNPYIHIAPKFNKDGLYGDRENDAIGLICGGDFGLTMVSSAWANYERQNKNYQNIFDRQVQNLEVQQKYQKFGEQINAATGIIGGAAGGAMTGGLFGGAGAVIGGLAGGTFSALGGIADIAINDKLRGEAIDYTKDQFGYQMGNIKALPDSLTRVNSLNPNNTIFPMLEFYGCTDQEVEALKNKIKYNGMSVGRVGTLKDFKNPEEETYIKGQIIVLDINDDFHLASDIANEIYKGVRI